MHSLLRQVFVAILGGVITAGALLAFNSFKPGPTMALAQTNISQVGADSSAAPDAPNVDATKMINYQGQIFNPATGQPYVNTPLNATFSFWDAATGGTQVYTEDRFIQTNSDGFFSTNIGDLSNFNRPPNISTYDVFNGEARYLQVVIMGQQLGPRQPLTFVPFAMWAYHSHHLDEYDADDFPKFVAHGVVNGDGSRRAGARFNSSIQVVGGQSGVYVIDIEGVNDFSVEEYMVNVVPACESPVFHGIGSSAGDLVVDMWNPSGTRVQCKFQFQVYEK
jgi:hypothetical protein